MKLNRWTPLFWIAPAFLLLVLIVAYPTIYAIGLSFVQWNLTRPSNGITFVAFDNFIRVFQDSVFLETLRNLTVFVAGSVGLEFAIGISLALVMSQRLPGIRLARTLLIAPVMVAPVISGLMWKYMYFSGYGIVPFLLGKAGISVGDGILATHGSALAAIIVTDVWQWTPFVVLVSVAGLQGISQDALEAAEVDGASKWQTFWHVTLPLLKPILLVTLLLRLMDSIKAFDIIYAMTRGGPGNSTMMPSYYGYQQSLNFFEIGYGAAIALIILLIVLLLSQIFIRVVYRNDKI